jgi:hypothetical protein
MKIMPLASTARGLPRSPRPPHRGRRGALLLLVLGMLTLFMMIGTLMLVLAMRARSTSRAFADAVAGSGNRAAAARGLLDEALMRLVRGVPLPAGGAQPDHESLLADRYGTATLEGKLQAIPTATGPVLRATVTGINAAKPLELVGRILTIKPQATDPAPVTSFRILAVNGTEFTLANLRTVGVRPLPTQFDPDPEVFVNGREFTGQSGHESWDGFDDGDDDKPTDPFLTRASSGTPVTVDRPAYQPAGGNLEVDNDGDGVADGIWLGNPDDPDDPANFLPEPPDGSKVRVSFLVLDLGGRLNVNAHGAGGTGGAVGPRDVNGGPVLQNTDAWTRLLAGGDTPDELPQSPATGNRRPAPALGSGLQGRFGGVQDNNRDTYALRLDFDGPRSASLAAANGVANLFTYGELERVLRPFDRDTASLPPRLAALLGDSAEPRRMLVTTDSWDTCGMVGAAAREVIANGDPATLPDEAKEGYRFNLNRPLGDDDAKQQFFSDLLAVVEAVAPDAPDPAQWVANVVDFIDTDTTVGSYTLPGGGSVTGVEPTALKEGLPAALPVKNPGSFTSPAELLAVPTGTKEQIEQRFDPTPPAPPQSITSLAVTHPQILDAVTVESRFSSTVFVESGGRRLCRWREPGRINVNTCDDTVWAALTGQNIDNPFEASPAQTLSGVLLGVPEVFNVAAAGVPGTPEFSQDVRKWNGTLANRLANIATTRSDVLAVWITLEMKQSSDSSPEYHRLFAIVDRSIPVGHAAGQDLNARDTLRVLRHLE